jgi:hypothetical protein
MILGKKPLETQKIPRILLTLQQMLFAVWLISFVTFEELLEIRAILDIFICTDVQNSLNIHKLNFML